MKQSRLLFGLVLGGVLLFSGTSCVDSSFLDETVTEDLTKEKLFGDSALTAGFLSNIYSKISMDIMPNRFGPGGLQTACDEAEFKANSDVKMDQMFVLGTINAVKVDWGFWKECYTKIRAVNVFLANLDGCPMAESAKVLYRAEARFLRAWYYFMLVRHYGGVPMLGDLIYDNENYESMDMTRATFADCIEYIVSECEAAARDLPMRRNGVTFGRASSGSCWGLICRARLYAASKLYNGTTHTDNEQLKPLVGYPTYDKERWLPAIEAAEKIISSGDFQIYDRHMDRDGNEIPGWGRTAIFDPSDCNTYNTYKDKKYTSGAYCCHIFTYHGDAGLGRESNFFPPTCGGGGDGGYPNLDLAEAFPMADGKPAIYQGNPTTPVEGDLTRSKYAYDRMKMGENRDPRFKFWFIWNGSTCYAPGFAENTIYTYQGVGATNDAINKATRTGLYFRKGTYFSKYLIGVPQTYCLIRFEEILLNWAEAMIEYHGAAVSKTPRQLGRYSLTPLEVLKMIREGAGIEPGDDGRYGLAEGIENSDDAMMEAIRLERRLELMTEGHRFFDVRRWMIAETTENCMIHGFEITRKLDGTESGRVINVRQHTFRNAAYFWPLPYDEVNRSETLLQNPYYE